MQGRRDQDIQEIVKNHLGVSQPNLRRHFQKPVFAEERYPIVPNNVMYPQPALSSQGSAPYLGNGIPQGRHAYGTVDLEQRKMQPIFPIGLSSKPYPGKFRKSITLIKLSV